MHLPPLVFSPVFSQRQVMIRTLIFDLSEVLIAGLCGIEKPLATRLQVDAQTILPAFAGQLLEDLCCGRLSEDEYLAGIRRRQQWDITAPEVKRIIRDNFHHRVPGMEELVTQLAHRHELILLSDHAVEWVAYIQGIHPFLRIFKARFFSFELKQTKRDSSTFRKVLDAIGRKAEHCLLVDDSAPNLSAAASIGIPGVRFTSTDALARELTARGLLGQLLASPALSSVPQR
jgi:HAD superfamily hydrolase (TIGR01509 family)